MSDSEQKVNAALRSWTRGVSFTLAMGKTQVATLVSAHLSQGRVGLPVGHGHKSHRLFVGAMAGLEERGLVVPHIWIAHREGDKAKRDALSKAPYEKLYQITEAGEHVIALLKLSGVYEELRAEFEEADARAIAARLARIA